MLSRKPTIAAMTDKPNTPTVSPSYVRWSADDSRIVLALQAKLGIKVTELVKQAIRALAAKEGVTA